MRTVLVACLVLLAGCADSAEAPPEEAFDEELDASLRATDDTGVIRGVVVDEAIVPVEGVRVQLDGQDREATTNAAGAFGFDGLAPGTYFLSVSKLGYQATQASQDVQAGVDTPPVLKVRLISEPSSLPYVEAITLRGHLACGVAVIYTSVGCTTNGLLSSTTDSVSIWSLDFERLFNWTQGELVWKNTQAGAGDFVWQIVQSEFPGTPQPHIGYMETAGAPALAYLDQATVDEYADWIMEFGIDYRFFGGPHELCPKDVGDPSVNRFGCGVTVDQSTEAFVHHFFNFVPDEGWRYTVDGAPVIPS